MKTRVITAIIMAIFGLPLLIFSNTPIYPVAAGILAAISVFEVLRVMGIQKKLLISIPSLIIAVPLPLFADDFFHEWYPGGVGHFPHFTYFCIVLCVFFIYLLYLITVAVFTKGAVSVQTIGPVFISVFYVVASFTSLVISRTLEGGAFTFLLAFICPWFSDMFAYFTGRLFGKHKLIPEISPKKTVEGAIGGIIFGTAIAPIYGFVATLMPFGLTEGVVPNYIVLTVAGFILSIVGQVGDLWASLIKRSYGAKDFSNIFPGHGGVLDRFDSVLACSTVLMIISAIFPPFTVTPV